MINYLADYPMISMVVNVVLVIIGLGLFVNLFTVFSAKTLSGRVVGLDALGTQTMALIILYAFKHGTDLYMAAVLVLSILGFVTLVVWSKYIQKGNVVYSMRKTTAEDEEGGEYSHEYDK